MTEDEARERLRQSAPPSAQNLFDYWLEKTGNNVKQSCDLALAAFKHEPTYQQLKSEVF